MAEQQFAVQFDSNVNTGSRDGVKGAIVAAENSTDAKALLKALHGDDVDAGWDNATYTAMAAEADLNGWSLNVSVISAAGVVLADETVTGDGTNKTVDLIAALMVTALNGTASIANASYNATSNTLTVASAADGIGDAHIAVSMTPPGSSVAVPGFVGTITDQGVAAAALTVALASDSYTVPKVTAQFAEKFGG